MVGGSVAACGVLAALGIIGDDRDERFDAKLIVVSPEGAGGVHVREIVDEDFGRFERHGYQRIIPNDFGVPTNISASSPDASATLNISDLGSDTRIRLGDADTTINGPHRYIVDYTLPDAHLGNGELALDIIGNKETLRTTRFEVLVTGFQLTDPTCKVGSFGDTRDCEITPEGADFRIVLEPLEPEQGVTIGGTITGTTPPTDVPTPPLPDRRPSHRTQLALAMLPLGALGGAASYLIARRRGRNEVFGSGAADAAYGELPAPGTNDAAFATTRLVADADLGAMATIEFVPPKGIEPWQGAVLLRESIDDSTVSAWFSGLVAKDAIDLQKEGSRVTLVPGPKRGELDIKSAAHLDAILHGRDELILGSYDKAFTAEWRSVRADQVEQISESGWWKHLPPGASSSGGQAQALIFAAIVLAVCVGLGTALVAALVVFRSWPLALVFGLVAPAVMAMFVYRVLLPARSGAGSALALRTESFRRFLEQSESKHVEWAWKQGLLREYSAWAVALGEADAWTHALAGANVPQSAAQFATTPLIFHSMGSSIAASHTTPSSSGSSSGFSGGFSGGSVGGGGGGGSSGSW